MYKETIAKKIEKWQKRKSRRLKEEWQEAAIILMSIELEQVREDLEKCYSPDPRGVKPYDAVCMLRALLLMVILQYEKITKFAKDLKDYPRLGQIAGFEKGETPAASTFYLFIDRLEDGQYQKSCEHRIKPSELRKKKAIRNLKAEKEQKEIRKREIEAESDSITKHLKQELLAKQSQPRPKNLQKLLEDILMKVAIKESAKRGLLGDISKLKVCGDGSALESGSNCEGRPTCKCRALGIYKCSCDRIYSDPTANFGWDSYRECFYFGHSFYQHCVSINGHDLPIHISIGQASETDFTLSMKSLDRLLKMFSEHNFAGKIYSLSYDCGHDALGIYQYLISKDIKPVIALNPRNGELPKPSGTAKVVDSKGIPLCEAGLEMRYNGKRSDGRIYFNCPVKRPTHLDYKTVWKSYPDECPLGVLCQPDSLTGPVVYLRSKDDLRLYPTIARHSPEYKHLMNLRSGCERSNSSKKCTYKLANRPCRSSTHFLVRLYLISIVEHAKSWLAEDKKICANNWQSLINYSLAT
jgi:hypothetical protein